MRFPIFAAAITAALVAAFFVPASAADVDPRLAGPQVNALTALLALREAEIAAMKQDYQAEIARLKKAAEDKNKPQTTGDAK